MISSRFAPILAAGFTLATGMVHSAVLARYVLLGEGGALIARAITDEAPCPILEVDGRPARMTQRAGPATLPLRPTASKPEFSKPSEFPVRVCERRLPPGARDVQLLGRRLPLPPKRIDRILVIGDTGCRLKAADRAYQACKQSKAYPFAAIAARAAAWKPDVVLHVGDYLYRENPCPAGGDGCAGSPWGYGWDAWRADFFDPAAPLLAAAPWILVRGNHENCARAGQGWWRLLDTRPLEPGRDCINPANDFANDDEAPYAVPLGGGTQIVVMDLSIADTKPLAPDDPRRAQFIRDYDVLAALSSRTRFTFLADHKPILGVGATQRANGEIALFPGNEAIQSAFASRNPRLFPGGVEVLLSGHIHLWEQVSFASHYPSQFIAGFSGTQEDVVPLPEKLPASFAPASGARPDRFSSWIDGFGYMTLQRADPGRWHVRVWNAQGQVMNRCEIAGRRSWCERDKVRF